VNDDYEAMRNVNNEGDDGHCSRYAVSHECKSIFLP
jgi:hypothetical protein